MAKFTKLNIGDAVASSGGRVWKKLSAESGVDDSTIVGTWVFSSGELTPADTYQDIYFGEVIIGTYNAQSVASDTNLTSKEYDIYRMKIFDSDNGGGYACYNASSANYPVASIQRQATNSYPYILAGYKTSTYGGYYEIYVEPDDEAFTTLSTVTISSADMENTQVQVLHSYLKVNATKIA